MTRLHVIGSVVAAFLALWALIWWQSQSIERLRTENVALTASVAAYKLDAELSQAAQDVADARAKWFEGKALEYDNLREGILRDGKDADLPDWLADVLVGLRNPDGQTD